MDTVEGLNQALLVRIIHFDPCCPFLDIFWSDLQDSVRCIKPTGICSAYPPREDDNFMFSGGYQAVNDLKGEFYGEVSEGPGK